MAAACMYTPLFLHVISAYLLLERCSSSASLQHYPGQVTQLSGLIELINGDLSKLDRKKLITLCTIDVHARDVVQRLIDDRVESATCFQWQSQMRYVVSEKTKLCQVRPICTAAGPKFLAAVRF